MMRRIHVFAIALAITVQGCSSEVQPAQEIRADPLASDNVVTNDSSGAIGWFQAEQVLRIGAAEGGTRESFHTISDLAMDTDHRLFVANEGGMTVRVFDSAGVFLHEFGGRGQGPSEMTAIDGLSIHGDTVLISDSRSRKGLVYLSDGTFVDSWPAYDADGVSLSPILPMDDGWLVWRLPFNQASGAAGADSLVRVATTRVYIPDDRTVGEVVHRWIRSVEYATPAGDFTRPLFRPGRAMGFDRRGRFFVTRPYAYGIDVYSERGRLDRTILRDFTLRRVGRDDVDALRDRLAEIADTIVRGPVPLPPAVRARQREGALEEASERETSEAPEALPILGRLLVSADGSFWVEVLTGDAGIESAAHMFFSGRESSAYSRETRWDLFDTAGSYLGAFPMPENFNPMVVRGREVFGVQTTELGTEDVVGFRAVH